MSVPLHHDEHGAPHRPPLLLTGSLGTSTAMWDPQVPALAERFRLVRADHRGHGRSPAPPGPYRIGDLGRDLRALLDRLGVDRAHVCGLSLGGMAAMWLAAHHPERVDRLVLCATSAKLATAEEWHVIARAARTDGTAAIAEEVIGDWFRPDFAEDHPDVVTRMRGMVEHTADEGYAACCEAIADMDLRAQLTDVRASTLVVAGADDVATPPDHAHELAEAIPDAREVVLDDAAHLLNVEQPAAATDLVLAHLAG